MNESSLPIGLEPYSAEQNKRFFGRDKEIDLLVSNVQAVRLTVAYGDSKVGMTSLLQAGVFAELEEKRSTTLSLSLSGSLAQYKYPIFMPIYLDYQEIYESLGDYTVYQKLGQYLENALLKASVTTNFSRENPLTKESFLEYLRACCDTLSTPESHGRIYLIIDNADLAMASTLHNDSFYLDILIPVLQCSDIVVNFLLGLRRDSVIQLDQFQQITDLLANRYLIRPLGMDVVHSDILPKLLAYSQDESRDISCPVSADGICKNIIQEIDKYQSLVSCHYSKGNKNIISSTYLQLVSFSNGHSGNLNLELVLDKYIEDHFCDYTNDERIIASIFIHYISSAGAAHTLTSERLFGLIAKDPYLLVNAPFSNSQLNRVEDNKVSPQFSELGNQVLSTLSQSKLVGKHGSSYEIHPDFQMALMKWKDSILSAAILHNAGQASSIASQSIIRSLKLSQSTEMDLPEIELSGLLALQAYSFSKYTNADFKSPIFDEAFREFLKYPYYIKELRSGGDNQPEVSAVTLSHDNKRIATVDSSGKVLIFEGDFLRRDWKSEDIKRYPLIETGEVKATSIAFHPKHKDILFIGYRNGAVTRCDLREGVETPILYQCKEPSEDFSGPQPDLGVGPGPLAFNSDGSWLAFGSWNNQVTLWNLTDNYKTPKLNGDYQLEDWEFLDDWIWSISFSHATHKFAVGTRNGMVIIYDIKELGQGNSLVYPPYDVIHLSDILATTPFTAKKAAAFDPNERPFEIFSLAYSPNDKWIAVGSYGLVCIFDPLLADRRQIKQKLKEWESQKQANTFQRVHPPMCRQTIIRYSSEKDRGIRSLAFSHDSKYLCIGSDDFIADPSAPKGVNDQTLRLWDITKRDAPAVNLRASTKHGFGVNSVLFAKASSDEDFRTSPFVLTSSWDGTVRLWYLERSRTEPLLFGSQHGPVRAVSWSTNGKWLASAAWDETNSVCLWNCDWLWPKSGSQQNRPLHLPGSFYGNSNLAFSINNKFLASGGYQGDNHVRVWDLEQVKCDDKGIWLLPDPTKLQGHAGEVRAVAFSKDYLVSGGWDRTLKIWDAKSFEPLGTLNNFPGALTCMAISKDQKWLAVGTGKTIDESHHGTLILLDLKSVLNHLETDKSVKDFFSIDQQIRSSVDTSIKETFSVAICPQSKLLASVGRDNLLRVYDLLEKKYVLIEPKNENMKEDVFAGSSVAFSAKGTMLAVGSWSSNEQDKTLKYGSVWLWQVNHIQEELLNGSTLDLSIGQSIRHPIVLRIPPSQIIDLPDQPYRSQYHVTSIAFSPAPHHANANDQSHDNDSQFLAFGSNDWTIRIWTVGTGMLAKLTARELNRNLDVSEWDEYVDQGYRITPYEYTLPENLVQMKTVGVPASAKPSWLSQHLDALGCPPWDSSIPPQDEPDEKQQAADADNSVDRVGIESPDHGVDGAEDSAAGGAGG